MSKSWACLQACAIVLLAVLLTVGVATVPAQADEPATVTISGTILAGGAPLAGASVTLVWDASYDAEGETGRCCTVVVGDDGRYTITQTLPTFGDEGALPGWFAVDVVADGFLGNTSGPFPVTPDANVTADVSLTRVDQREARVAGTVSGTDGSALAGALVRVSSVAIDGHTNEPVWTVETIAGADGSFDVVAQPEAATIEVTATDHLAWSGSLTPSREQVVRVDVTLLRPSVLSGVVTDRAGRPLGGALVTVEGDGWQSATVVAADGSYVLPLAGRGSARIIVSAAGYRGQVQVVTVFPEGTDVFDAALAKAPGKK